MESQDHLSQGPQYICPLYAAILGERLDASGFQACDHNCRVNPLFSQTNKLRVETDTVGEGEGILDLVTYDASVQQIYALLDKKADSGLSPVEESELSRLTQLIHQEDQDRSNTRVTPEVQDALDRVTFTVFQMFGLQVSPIQLIEMTEALQAKLLGNNFSDLAFEIMKLEVRIAAAACMQKALVPQELLARLLMLGF